MLDSSDITFFGRKGRVLYKDLVPIVYVGDYISKQSLNSIMNLVD